MKGPTDEAGNAVLAFQSAAHNLTAIGELTSKLVAIAESGHWRRYRNAQGLHEWRAAEFDYFLIACDLPWTDVARVVAYNRAGTTIAPLMDHNASSSKRRSMEAASKAWHARGPETLIAAAIRLGWADKPAPVSPRARTGQTYGQTPDERAQATREQLLDPRRRRQLDRIADQMVNDIERRYLAAVLRNQSRDHDRWRRHVKEYDGNAIRLAKLWGVSRSQATRRIKSLDDTPRR